MNTVIRAMEMDDLEEVAAIEKATFSEPWTKDGFASSLRRDYTRYLVCTEEETGRILGYCGYMRSFEEADISNMAIMEMYRGKSLGHQLLKELMEQGYQDGIERFTLEVRESNSPAIHLYESLGFHTEGVRKHFYSHPTENALIMWTR